MKRTKKIKCDDDNYIWYEETAGERLAKLLYEKEQEIKRIKDDYFYDSYKESVDKTESRLRRRYRGKSLSTNKTNK